MNMNQYPSGAMDNMNSMNMNMPMNMPPPQQQVSLPAYCVNVCVLVHCRPGLMLPMDSRK